MNNDWLFIPTDKSNTFPNQAAENLAAPVDHVEKDKVCIYIL